MKSNLIALVFGVLATERTTGVSSAQTVDNGKAAFTGKCSFDSNSPQTLGGTNTVATCALATLPPGKRWVIEEAAANSLFCGATTPPAPMYNFFLPGIYSSSGVNALTIPMTGIAQTVGNDDGFGITRWFGATLTGQRYADTETKIRVKRFPGTLNQTTSWQLSASGYLIDLP